VTKDLTDNGGRCNILGCSFYTESAEEVELRLVPMEGDKIMVVDLGFWMNVDPGYTVR
jgi:hypothetical protein